MSTYIALLREIKVGGHNILPMKELTALLENPDFKNIDTYILTGNVGFQCESSNIPQGSKENGTKVKKKSELLELKSKGFYRNTPEGIR